MPVVQITDIGASLQKGPVWGTVITKFLWIMLIVMGLTSIAFVMASIFSWEKLGVIGVLGFAAEISLLDIVILYFIVRNQRLKKAINQWLQDAVLLKAFSYTVDSFRVYFQPIPAVSLQIRFRYLKTMYTQYSGTKKVTRYTTFAQYADRELLIAYSPKYDQVMLIKPQSEQRILAEMSK